MNKSWDITKKIVGNTKTKTKNLAGRTVIGAKETVDKKTIVKQFTEYIINIGTNFILVNIDPHQSFLVFLKCWSELCTTVFVNIWQRKTFYT